MATRYDALGRVYETVDPLGSISHIDYDRLSRPITQTLNYDAGGAADADTNVATGQTYDALGRVTASVDALGATTTTDYDGLGNVKQLIDPRNRQTRLGYDGSGTPRWRKRADGQLTLYQIDGLGRVVKTISNYQDGVVGFGEPSDQDLSTGVVYDANGRQVQTIAADGRVTAFGYDSDSRLVSVTENLQSGTCTLDPCNVLTRYSYDRAGNRVAITDANSHTRRFIYDAADQVVLATDALGRISSWSYNVRGQVQSQNDGRPDLLLQWSYDEMGRLKQTSEARGGILYLTTRAYDGLGRRTRLSDVGGTTDYSYDALGRITNVQTPDLQSVGYGYNARGQRTELTYPDTITLDYGYWPDGQLQSVSLGNATLASYLYDTAGRLEQATLANSAITTYDYDGADRLTDLRTRVHNADISRFQYTLDRAGQRSAASETLSELLGGQLIAQTRTITHTYDGLRRLTDAGESPGATYHYDYDAAGNRTRVKLNGFMTEMRLYDAANQVDDWNYDAAGNLLQDDTTTYTYDAFNRLLTATTNGQTHRYEYNGDGVVMAQDAVHYTQDVAAPLSQVLQTTEGLTTRYLYGLNRLVALKGNTGAWYVGDGLGSVRQTLSDAGAPLSKVKPARQET